MSQGPSILGIETSCDETAAAVVRGRRVLSNVVASQVPVHARYGGVVPELASRNHLLAVLPAVERAFERAGLAPDALDAIAVTRGPGLIGSLLVGYQTAAALARVWGLPLVPIDHVEAHICAVHLDPPPGDAPAGAPTDPPYVALVASGGHTALYLVRDFGRQDVLGHTLDDAAGEAFDKIAKMLGLPYPGGVAIERSARAGRADAWRFPRALLGPSSLDFSFSGLKTAVRYALRDAFGAEPPGGTDLADVCAAAQEAIVDVLVEKAARAVRATGLGRVVLAGGVAANARLRERMVERGEQEGFDVVLTPLAYCTDNAAMVAGLAARLVETRGLDAWRDAPLRADVYANLACGTPRTVRARTP